MLGQGSNFGTGDSNSFAAVGVDASQASANFSSSSASDPGFMNSVLSSFLRLTFRAGKVADKRKQLTSEAAQLTSQTSKVLQTSQELSDMILETRSDLQPISSFMMSQNMSVGSTLDSFGESSLQSPFNPPACSSPKVTSENDAEGDKFKSFENEEDRDFTVESVRSSDEEQDEANKTIIVRAEFASTPTAPLPPSLPPSPLEQVTAPPAKKKRARKVYVQTRDYNLRSKGPPKENEGDGAGGAVGDGHAEGSV
jgi:hypothetical protein